MPDLISLFNNLADVLPAGINLVFAFIGLAGLTFGILAIADAYQHAIGEKSPGLASKGSIPVRLVLAGAMTVIPLLLWRAANTFVLGGGATADMFSYVGGNTDTQYCKLFHQTLTYFFMFIGTNAIAFGLIEINGKASGRSNKSWFQPTTFVIGGVACFFIEDIALLASNELKMEISLSNICGNLRR